MTGWCFRAAPFFFSINPPPLPPPPPSPTDSLHSPHFLCAPLSTSLYFWGKRMKDALTKMNDKSTNMCMYLICIVIIMGIAYLGYDMAKKKGMVK
jgi:hypothetical protein